MASSSSHNMLYTWSLDTGVRESSVKTQQLLMCLCFLESAHCLVGGDDLGLLNLYFVRPSKFRGFKALWLSTEPLSTQSSGGTPVSALTCSGDLLLCGNARGEVICFDVAPIVASVRARELHLDALRFAGHHLQPEVLNAEVLPTFQTPLWRVATHEAPLSSLTLSAAPRALLVAARTPCVVVLALPGGERLAALDGWGAGNPTVDGAGEGAEPTQAPFLFAPEVASCRSQEAAITQRVLSVLVEGSPQEEGPLKYTPLASRPAFAALVVGSGDAEAPILALASRLDRLDRAKARAEAEAKAMLQKAMDPLGFEALSFSRPRSQYGLATAGAGAVPGKISTASTTPSRAQTAGFRPRDSDKKAMEMSRLRIIKSAPFLLFSSPLPAKSLTCALLCALIRLLTQLEEAQALYRGRFGDSDRYANGHYGPNKGPKAKRAPKSLPGPADPPASTSSTSNSAKPTLPSSDPASKSNNTRTHTQSPGSGAKRPESQPRASQGSQGSRAPSELDAQSAPPSQHTLRLSSALAASHAPVREPQRSLRASASQPALARLGSRPGRAGDGNGAALSRSREALLSSEAGSGKAGTPLAPSREPEPRDNYHRPASPGSGSGSAQHQIVHPSPGSRGLTQASSSQTSTGLPGLPRAASGTRDAGREGAEQKAESRRANDGPTGDALERISAGRLSFTLSRSASVQSLPRHKSASKTRDRLSLVALAGAQAQQKKVFTFQEAERKRMSPSELQAALALEQAMGLK